MPPLGQAEYLRYEIFHDVLAQAILDWRARYGRAKEQTERRKELQQLRSLLIRWVISFVVNLLLYLPVGVLIIIWVLRRQSPPFGGGMRLRLLSGGYQLRS